MPKHGAAVELGFSTCPNDTFMFHALIHGLLDDSLQISGIKFEPVMKDIEALNLLAWTDEALPVTKLSVSALFSLTDRYTCLSAGAALGRGCGPLLVTKERLGSTFNTLEDLEGRRIGIPGVHTSAYLLLKIFSQATFEPVEMTFDEIMPAVARGELDAGLIIHESRFTYREHGLVAVADLGQEWEKSSGLPLPLGVICGKRELGIERLGALSAGIRASIKFARLHPELSVDWIRMHAQELDEELCQRHIALYVNDFSLDLGAEGREAILALLERAKACGIVDRTTTLEIH